MEVPRASMALAQVSSVLVTLVTHTPTTSLTRLSGLTCRLARISSQPRHGSWIRARVHRH